MKKIIKNYAIMVCLAAGLTAGFTGVSAVNVSAAENNRLTMEKGAYLYLGDGISGLKFAYTISDYNVETDNGNYGMLIVPYDYLIAAGINDLTDTTVDYIARLEAALEEETISYAPIVKEGLTPDATGKVQYSIGSLYESNYVRQFFGIGFEKTETDNGDGTTSVSYSYAVQNENVRSVFEVANIAVNKINFEGLEDTEEITWSEVETNYLNPYLEKGYKFVYGDNAPEISFEMTYVGAEAVVVETTEKATGKENVELSIQWHYSMDKNDTVAELTENDTVKGLSRGQTTVTAQLGSLSSLTVEATVSVLKDATEYQIYQNSTDADFFAAEEVANDNAYSTVRLNGGYWNDIESTSAYQNPGYIAIKNPNSEDGTYSLSTTKLWMDFYFTGNNMPNVEFFGTQIEGLDFGAYGGGTTGYVITNGIARNDTYYEYTQTVLPSYDAETATYDTTNWGTHSTTYAYGGIVGSANFFRFGSSGYGALKRSNGRAAYNKYFGSSYALDTTNKSSGYNVMQYASSAWTNKAMAYGSKFSMYELMKDETQQWHYKVGMYLKSTGSNAGKTMFAAYLYAVDAETGEETLHISVSDKIVKNSTTVDTAGGYIIVHGALKGSLAKCKAAGNEDYYYTKFAYKMPY